MKRSVFAISIFLGLQIAQQSESQTLYKFSNNCLTIDNGFISRIVNFSNDSVVSGGLYLKGIERNYLQPRSAEFQLILNDEKISGYTGWKIVSCYPESDGHNGNGAVLKLTGKGIAEGIEISISYLTYPGLPLIRKWITFRNNSSSVMKLEAVDIEVA